MARLCFFTNPWASGELRRQVTEAVGGAVNPELVNEDDVVVLIKRLPAENSVSSVPNLWIDVIDWYGCLPFLDAHPSVGIIACSRKGEEYLRKKFPNKVVLIEEHHCNFENVTLNVEKPVTVGFIGYPDNLHLSIDSIVNTLRAFNMRFVHKFEFANRFDVVDFYRSIDIQFTFRKEHVASCLFPELKNPLKLANAGSFGIPTICCSELTTVDEFGGCFMPADSIDGLAYWCERLRKEPELYRQYSMLSLERSKQYHIDVIASKWKALLQDAVSDNRQS